MNKMYMLYLLILVLILLFIKLYNHNYKNVKENFNNLPINIENFIPIEKSKESPNLKESYYCGIVPYNTSEHDEYLIDLPEPLFRLKNNKIPPKPLNYLYYHKKANLILQPFIKKKIFNTVPLRPQKYKEMIIRPFDQDLRRIKSIN